MNNKTKKGIKMAVIMKMDTYRKSILVKQVLKLVEEELSTNGGAYGLECKVKEYKRKSKQEDKLYFTSYMPISLTRH